MGGGGVSYSILIHLEIFDLCNGMMYSNIGKQWR